VKRGPSQQFIDDTLFDAWERKREGGKKSTNISRDKRNSCCEKKINGKKEAELKRNSSRVTKNRKNVP